MQLSMHAYINLCLHVHCTCMCSVLYCKLQHVLCIVPTVCVLYCKLQQLYNLLFLLSGSYSYSLLVNVSTMFTCVLYCKLQQLYNIVPAVCLSLIVFLSMRLHVHDIIYYLTVQSYYSGGVTVLILSISLTIGVTYITIYSVICNVIHSVYSTHPLSHYNELEGLVSCV